jgi:hypothetical protein
MFKKNKHHLQPVLISSVNELPAEMRQHLEVSWAGVFYREFFCRLDEEAFAVLYADIPSRPNVPVNVLVGLEYLKAGFGWSDEEMYAAFQYNLQVRYALGYDEFGTGHFDLRTLYYFRERLSRYMQEKGVNLLDQAFEQVTDQQIAAFQLKTNLQRMDSTQIGSHIREMGRLQLLVEVLQRVHRSLNADDQAHYREAFAAYLQGQAGQYVYRLRREENAKHIQRIGEFMQGLLSELAGGYREDPAYQILERVFNEHFKLEAGRAISKAGGELSATSLQSPDDLEATFRRKAGKGYRGYVANVTETCHPDNPLNLITEVQVAPNSVDDTHLLEQALPNLKQRMNLDTLYTDGGHGGPGPDAVLEEQHVTQIQSGLRGNRPEPQKFSLSDFAIQFSEAGEPVQVTCPQKQQVPLCPGHLNKGLVAYFNPTICQTCPFWQAQKCTTVPGKRGGGQRLYVNWVSAHSSQRRRRSQIQKTQPQNLRAAIEATIRSIKHPFPSGKLPVRGLFRMTCLMIGSAGMTNVRRIQRHLIASHPSNQTGNPFSPFINRLWESWIHFIRLSKPYFAC